MITLNDTIPNVDLYTFDRHNKKTVPIKAHQLLKGRIILVGVPGAFTNTCSTVHIPGFIKYSPQFKQHLNIDLICCIAINDPYIMNRWRESFLQSDSMLFISDGNGKFTKALGLTQDLQHLGMNIRSKRYSMLIENHIVKLLAIDEARSGCVLSAAEQFFKDVQHISRQ